LAGAGTEACTALLTNVGACAKAWLRVRHASAQPRSSSGGSAFNHVMGLPSLCAESYAMPWAPPSADDDDDDDGDLVAILKCSARLPTRAEAEAVLRTHRPGAALLQAPFAHDWLADPWSRGTWMVRPLEKNRSPLPLQLLSTPTRIWN
jgi:hypothetical protein